MRIDDGKVNVVSHRVIESFTPALDRSRPRPPRWPSIGRDGKLSAGFDLTEMTAGIDRARALVGAGGRLLMRIFAHPSRSWSRSPGTPSPPAR